MTLNGALSYRVAVIHPNVPAGGLWLDDSVKDKAFAFTKVACFKATPSLARRWMGRIGQALRAFRGNPDVIVAVFPHLALSAAFWKFLLRRRTKIVAWSFNIPPYVEGYGRPIISWLSRYIELMIPHSRVEVQLYQSIYGIPPERLAYVPYPVGAIEVGVPEDPVEPPYIVAMGSMQRDYATLFEAVRDLDVHVLVIADDHALSGLTPPGNVMVRNGLSRAECHALAAQATVMALPISRENTASGHITLVTAMHLGVPLVATDCASIADYVRDSETAVLVPPEDAQALRAALLRVVGDEALRKSLAARAREDWAAEFSLEAAARNLAAVLHAVLDNGRVPYASP